jgi:hypothetical protein
MHRVLRGSLKQGYLPRTATKLGSGALKSLTFCLHVRILSAERHCQSPQTSYAIHLLIVYLCPHVASDGLIWST